MLSLRLSDIDLVCAEKYEKIQHNTLANKKRKRYKIKFSVYHFTPHRGRESKIVNWPQT